MKRLAVKSLIVAAMLGSSAIALAQTAAADSAGKTQAGINYTQPKD
jgi:hypothetical protein